MITRCFGARAKLHPGSNKRAFVTARRSSLVPLTWLGRSPYNALWQYMRGPREVALPVPEGHSTGNSLHPLVNLSALSWTG